MKKVNLLLIATAKYTQYLQPLIESADKYFLTPHEVTYCVFTDNPNLAITSNRQIRYFTVEHRGWPWATLMRFDYFLSHRDKLPLAEYTYYVDVDVLFKSPIGDEIFGDLVAVEHCGFIGERGTYETRPKSLAYVRPNEGRKYYGGGFMGGNKAFWDAIGILRDNINKDNHKGVVAVHHDESHWNKYLIGHPPTVELSPSYHYPDGIEHIYDKWRKAGVWFEPKILLLNKDHESIRG
jgi:histo-blood group ABO system transferase